MSKESKDEVEMHCPKGNLLVLFLCYYHYFHYYSMERETEES